MGTASTADSDGCRGVMVEPPDYDWAEKHFAAGSCRYAYKGKLNYSLYNKDTGETWKKGPIVVKRFKHKVVYDKSDWNGDISCHRKAKELVNGWNRLQLINKKFTVTVPWAMRSIGKLEWDKNTEQAYYQRPKYPGEWVVAEKYLNGDWVKWNNNGSYVYDRQSSVQAFCHWTFHHSNKTLLYCDAQGIRTSTEIKFSDPCIVSVNGFGKYGMTDIGIEAINDFFYAHKCNKFCKSYWKKPKHVRTPRYPTYSKSSRYTWDEQFNHPTKRLTMGLAI
eukprot:516106_1